MQTHPRTREGGFWHKRIYPHQMWLDGVYMASPFLAEFAVRFDEPRLLDDVVNKFVSSRSTPATPRVDFFITAGTRASNSAGPIRRPAPRHNFGAAPWAGTRWRWSTSSISCRRIIRSARPCSVCSSVSRRSIAKVQDAAPAFGGRCSTPAGREKNYRELRRSAMFVYALAKAVRRGCSIGGHTSPSLARGYRGIVDQFLEIDARGHVNLNRACKVAGLGGNPYRDGSYDYYTARKSWPTIPKASARSSWPASKLRSGAPMNSYSARRRRESRCRSCRQS